MKVSAEKLQYQMAKNFMSASDLADACGLSRMAISEIKNGHVTNPRPATLRKLCLALNCDADDLLELKGDR